jgi:hypothetical protein
VTALIQRVKTGGRPSVDESRFVFGGEAHLRITVADTSAAAMEQLRNAGLVIIRREGNIISGRIAVGNVEALSKLPFITWIAARQ